MDDFPMEGITIGDAVLVGEGCIRIAIESQGLREIVALQLIRPTP
jgi:hypothetical protein